jgi:hypothetical protein
VLLVPRYFLALGVDKMRLLALCTIVGLAAAAPVHEDVVGRAVATPSIIATPISSVTVGPPASSATYAKEFPSSFPAPVQGSGKILRCEMRLMHILTLFPHLLGKLVIGNLPALPPVLDKAVLFAVNTVYGLGKLQAPASSGRILTHVVH